MRRTRRNGPWSNPAPKGPRPSRSACTVRCWKNARHDDRRARHCELVGLHEGDPEGMVVDGFELRGARERALLHLPLREPTRPDEAVERPFHILRGDRRPILEGRVPPQLERDGGLVRSDRPTLGQLQLQLRIVVGQRPVLQRRRPRTAEACRRSSSRGRRTPGWRLACAYHCSNRVCV